jgi:hypothetical protein
MVTGQILLGTKIGSAGRSFQVKEGRTNGFFFPLVNDFADSRRVVIMNKHFPQVTLLLGGTGALKTGLPHFGHFNWALGICQNSLSQKA